MIPSLRLQDVADIVIISFLVYQLYRWFRNTKALQVLIGLGLLGVVYFVTRNLGLLMTSWILQELGTVLVILLIVIFQNEIRQALYRFSLIRTLFDTRPVATTPPAYREVVQTVFDLAASRTGAIVVFQRGEPLEEHLMHGVPLDSLLNGPLLAGIFHKESALHDGAVIIRGDRVSSASCHLPLSSNPDVPRQYGTRHRAALGMSEATDAVVVVVSEERGEVSVAVGGTLEKVADPSRLAGILEELLVPPEEPAAARGPARMLLRNLRPKLAIVLMVVAAWLFVTGRQGEIVSLTVPVRFHSLPDRLTLMKTAPEEVELQLRVFSGFLPSPKVSDIVAEVDLSSVHEGTNTLVLRDTDFRLPLGVVVSSIDPQKIRVVAGRTLRKELRVVVKTAGRLPGGVRLRYVTADPATVTAEGPAESLSRVETVETETVDLSASTPGKGFEVRLVPPEAAKILDPENVTVRVMPSGRGRRGERN